jgi:hypothetical protein
MLLQDIPLKIRMSLLSRCLLYIYIYIYIYIYVPGSVPVESQGSESLTVPTIAQKSLELVSLKINNLRSSNSRSQMSSKTDTVNKEEISVVSSEKNWQN